MIACNVVERCQAKIIRVVNAHFFEGLQHSQGHHSVADEYRGRPDTPKQQFLCQAISRFLSEVTLENPLAIHADTGFAMRLFVAPEAFSRNLQFKRTGYDGDIAITNPQQMPDTVLRALHVVQHDGIHLYANGGSVHTDDGNPGCHDAPNVAAGFSWRAGKKDSINATRSQGRNDVLFSFDLLIGIGGKQKKGWL